MTLRTGGPGGAQGTPEALEALAPCPCPSDADPAAEVRAITRGARSSFALGIALLPAERRRAMHALYAFARIVDDIADGPWPAARKRAMLEAWRGEIRLLYQDDAVSAVGRALAPPVAAYDLPEAEFVALIEGMQMDAAGPILAPPMAELRLYSRRVAGAVGLLSMRIFGAWRGAVSERFALALGDALQFTNILRDVAEDARLGRLYLPAELLAAEGVPARPETALAHPALPGVCRRLAVLARLEFETARAAIPAHPRARLAPALAMMGSYEAMLGRLADRGFAPGPPIGRRGRLVGALARLARPGRSVPDV